MDWNQLLPSQACRAPQTERWFQRGGMLSGGPEKLWLVDGALDKVMTERELDPDGWRQEEVRGWVLDVRGEGVSLIFEPRIKPLIKGGWQGMGIVRIPKEALVSDLSLCLPHRGEGLRGCCLEEAIMLQKNGKGQARMLAVHAVKSHLVPHLPLVVESYLQQDNQEGEQLIPLGAWVESFAEGFYVLWGSKQGPIGWERVNSLGDVTEDRIATGRGRVALAGGVREVSLAAKLPVGAEEEMRVAFTNQGAI